MHHIFIYALPTDNTKEARISEISAVLVQGFGPYQRKDVKATFTRTSCENETKLVLNALKAELVPEDGTYVLVSLNEVTRALLRIEFEKTGTPDFFSGRAWIEVNQLVWPLVVGGYIPNRSLATVTGHFNLQPPKMSDSADVCTVLLQVYGQLMRRYSTALRGERFVSEVGGDSFQSFRNIIGI